MATLEELKAEQKQLEDDLKKVKSRIAKFDQEQEREKIKQVRILMDQLGLTFEQATFDKIKPKQRTPRKPKAAVTPTPILPAA